MKRGSSCAKYALFAFTAFFALSGITLMVVGGFILHDIDRFRALLESTYLAPPIVFIVVGVIVFITSFIGCCGAVNESPCKLKCFAGLLCLVLLAEIGVAALAFMGNDRFIHEVHRSMLASMKSYDPHVPGDKKLWDAIQAGLGCCGVDGPEDWKDKMDGLWPASCCVGFDPLVHRDHVCKLQFYVYKIGCHEKLKKKLTWNNFLVLGFASGFALLQVIGIILACVLASDIRKEGKKPGSHGD